MKQFFLFLCLTTVIFAQGQDVEVLQRFDSLSHEPLDNFTLLEEALDVSSLRRIAVVQVSDNHRSGVEQLFLQSKLKAESLGANSYRIVEFSNQEDGFRMVLDLYYADQIAIKGNEQHQPKNTVFVFGSDRPDKVISCKVNNRKIELPSFTYYSQENARGQEIKISKGGVTGMSVWITWAENKPARYVSLSGFGLSGGGLSNPGGYGAGFNTGRITYIDSDLGRFLSMVMTPLGSKN